MRYNNKNTLSALALILAMSFSLADVSYAQGVISLADDEVDELGLPADDTEKQPEEQAVAAVSEDVASEQVDADATAQEPAPMAEQENISLEIPLETAEPAPMPTADAADDENIPADNGLIDETTADDNILPEEDNADAVSPLLGGGKARANFGESLAEKQAQHEAEMENLAKLGDSVLSQIDNELFSQMSDIEKQTTLLSLELRREKLKSEIAAIKAERLRAIEEEQEQREEREQRKKDRQSEKEIELLKEQQLLKDKEIAFEALRQEKALNDYRNKMLETEQKWVEENQKLYDNIQKLEDERKSMLEDFGKKLDSLNDKSLKLTEAAELAHSSHSQAVAALNMQNTQLRKRLEAETSVGNNPFSGENSEESQITPNNLNKDYVIMEIRGKGADLVARLINKNGESFLVKKGSILQTGHIVENITHNYITLDKKGVKDYLQFTAGGVVDQEPTPSEILPVAAKIKEDSRQNNRPAPIHLMTDEGIPSLGNGMFVK